MILLALLHLETRSDRFEDIWTFPARSGDDPDLLDRQKEVGTVQAGRYADLIAVPGDPLQDMRVLERVAFVMKGGAVVKDELSATSAATTVRSSSK